MSAHTITKQDLQSALPDTETSLRIKGIDRPVEIYRDRYGIPHVMAKTVSDAFFGQGFATAQDRLWHMDYDRKRAYGRWAETAGPPALDQDKMMRRFQIGATVKGDYDAASADTRMMFDAYTAGVNAFMETTKSLPIEYFLTNTKPEPWQPWDGIAVYKVRHILMGVFEGKLWRARMVSALGPERTANLHRGYQPGHLVISPPGHEYDGAILDGLKELTEGLENLKWLPEDAHSGSNSWAVHGNRTASGKPLLAGDSHRPLDTPNVYYQNHIACPEFDVIGLSFPGCPGFPHFGHNGKVAWCVTHASADYQDLYIERFSPDDKTVYKYKDDWKKAEVRKETIQVKDSSDVELEVFITHHGPLIAGDPAAGFGLAFRYSATVEPNMGFDCFFKMLNTGSTDDMDAAMEKWVDPCNNFLLADADGNIGYLNRGQVPIRSMANAWLPVAGWTGEYEWQGDIPFDKLTRMRNPDPGFIVTANNRIVDKDYPYYIALNYVPEYRVRRLYNRLKEKTGATVEDMKSVHADRLSIPGQTFSQLLSGTEPLNDLAGSAKAILEGWDGVMDKDAIAPTIISAFRVKLLRKVIPHLMGPLADEMFTSTGRGAPRHLTELASLLVTMSRNNDTEFLPPGSDWPTVTAEALADATTYLKERLGPDINKWQWGRLHRTQPKHPLSDVYPEAAALLDPGDVAMGGDGDTPQAAGYSPGSPFGVTLLSVARYAYDTADWDNSGWAVPLGVSGHPGSPHYADQTAVWADVDLIPMYYSWDLVKANSESHQVIEPG